MATPVNDSYSTTSGGTIRAGMFLSSASLTVLSSTQTSSSSSVQVDNGALPSWSVGLSVNQVVEIAGSSPSVLGKTNNPGDTGSNWIDVWCGLSIDTRTSKIYSVANGGHGDYFGNEVNVINLKTNAPAWTQLKAQSASCASLSANNNDYYPDGQPASVHSYYTQHFIESRNRAARFGTGAKATSGNAGLSCVSFNISSNAYDAQGTYLPDVPHITYPYIGPICKISDLRTGTEAGSEDVYLFDTNNAVYQWSNASNTWSTVSLVGTYPPSALDGYVASAYDASRNRILLLKANNAWYYDVANKSFTTVTLSGTAAADISAIESLGMVYEPVIDKFIVKTGYGSNPKDFYSIDPATFAVTKMAVTGNASLPAPASISGTPQNVFGKFLYVPALSGVAYIPSYSANVWFLRTH